MFFSRSAASGRLSMFMEATLIGLSGLFFFFKKKKNITDEKDTCCVVSRVYEELDRVKMHYLYEI